MMGPKSFVRALWQRMVINMRATALFADGIWSIRSELYPGQGVVPAGSKQFQIDGDPEAVGWQPALAVFLFDEEFQLLDLRVSEVVLRMNLGHATAGISLLLGIEPLTKLVAAEYARKSVDMRACEVPLGELSYSREFAQELYENW